MWQKLYVEATAPPPCTGSQSCQLLCNFLFLLNTDFLPLELSLGKFKTILLNRSLPTEAVLRNIASNVTVVMLQLHAHQKNVTISFDKVFAGLLFDVDFAPAVHHSVGCFSGCFFRSCCLPVPGRITLLFRWLENHIWHCSGLGAPLSRFAREKRALPFPTYPPPSPYSLQTGSRQAPSLLPLC